MNSFREEMARLAEELCPGNELFAKLMSNAADTQERIAQEVLKRPPAAEGGNKEEK